MAPRADWRRIVASALDWEQAHATLDGAIDGLPADMRGKRPSNFPHSVWELLDHIRRTQHDLLDFCRNPAYQETLKFPDDYWPPTPAPPSDSAWNDSVMAIHRDTADFAAFTVEDGRDLTEKIPHGTGQTYLRSILVSIDHTSYHVGQIIAVRRLIGAWTAS
jgi:uncharacterized damage-inducible protein DinB